jgi:hypothetical protein
MFLRRKGRMGSANERRSKRHRAAALHDAARRIARHSIREVMECGGPMPRHLSPYRSTNSFSSSE